MNNNTKAKFLATNNKIRAERVRNSNPRSSYNKRGKVAAKRRSTVSE